MDLLDPTLLWGGTAATFLLFLVVALLARATRRRALGALLAGATFIPLVWFYDQVAAQQGLWYYPAVGAGSAPWLWYVAGALFYGAAIGLIGWRVVRRWGLRGLAAFVLLFALFGATRDYTYSQISRLIVFGPFPLSNLTDFCAYASGALLVQVLMRWIVGPAASDLLAPSLKRRLLPSLAGKGQG